MANKMSKQYKSNHLSLSKVIRLVNFINIHYKKNYLIGNTLFSWGLASKFTIFWALSLFDWPITKKVPEEVFTENIEKCKLLPPVALFQAFFVSHTASHLLVSRLAQPVSLVVQPRIHSEEQLRNVNQW
jgi:hypothetical protein